MNEALDAFAPYEERYISPAEKDHMSRLRRSGNHDRASGERQVRENEKHFPDLYEFSALPIAPETAADSSAAD